MRGLWRALAYAAGFRLGLPPWVVSIAISAAAVAMTYRVIAELTDGCGGIAAAMMLVGISIYRRLSIMVMSHTLLLFLGLVMVWAWLRSRLSASRRIAASVRTVPRVRRRRSTNPSCRRLGVAWRW